MRATIRFAVILCSAVLVPRAAAQAPDHTGQVPEPESLGALVNHSSAIAVLEVVKADRGEDVITFKKVADLKGKHPQDELRHSLLGSDDREDLLQWARPGRTAVFFCFGSKAVTCVGNHWNYNWDFGEPDGLWSTASWANGFRSTYVGSVAGLREAVTAILAGKEVVVTVQKPHDARDGPENSPIRRGWLRGPKGPVWRVKASLAIDAFADACCEESRHFVGRGVGDRSAVPALLVALQDSDPYARAEAADDLGGIGAEAGAAVPALRRALGDGDGRARVFAAAALARIDPDDKPSVPALLAALGGGTRDVRYAALAALGEIGPRARPALPVIATVLRDEPDEGLRSVAAFVIGRIGPGDDAAAALAALGRALREDRSLEVRLWAARALRPFGAGAKVVVPALATALTGADSKLTAEAADILARLGPAGVPALAAALAKGDRSEQRTLLAALAQMGPVAKPAVPAILLVMAKGDVTLRREATFALWKIDPQTARGKTLPVLAEILKGGEQKCGSHSIDALRILQEMGPAAKEVVPLVIAALNDESPLWSGLVRTEAARTLARLGPDVKESVAALEAALRDQDWDVRIAAARALWQLGRSREAVPVLLDSLASDNEACRQGAADAFGDLGPAGRVALPALRKALRNKDDPARLACARAVCRIERRVEFGNVMVEPRRGALDALAEMTRDKDPRIALSAADELSRIAPDKAVPALTEALGYEFLYFRSEAALILARLGPSARPALAALKARLKDDDCYSSRAAVAVALCRLGEREAGMPVLLRAVERYPELLYRFEEEIGSLGPQAQALVPCLERALWEGYNHASAARLLRRIDPKAADRADVP